MTFSDQFKERIYDRFAPDQIHPFVGGASRGGSADVLRVMGVGINAYVSAKDWPRRSPGWFASWFAPPRDRYQRGLWRDLKGPRLEGHGARIAPLREALLGWTPSI